MHELAAAERNADVRGSLAHRLEEHEIARLDIILADRLSGLVLFARLPGERRAVLCEDPLDETAAIESACRLTAAVPVWSATQGQGGSEVKGELVLKAPETPSPATGAEQVWKKLGIRSTPVPPEIVNRVNPQLRGGLSITDVDPNSPAARAGFQRGDVLIGLDKWETIATDNVLYVLNHPDLASFSPLRFFLVRGGQLKRGWLPTLD